MWEGLRDTLECGHYRSEAVLGNEGGIKGYSKASFYAIIVSQKKVA